MTNLVTMLVFTLLGVGFVIMNLVLSKIIRPDMKLPEKQMPYECGEVPIGSSWVQFDLRFYIVALVFLVFDVELALFYPWATVYAQYKSAALIDMLIFVAVIFVGFMYLWRFGYLEWVRSHVTTGLQAGGANAARTESLRQQARRSSEF